MRILLTLAVMGVLATVIACGSGGGSPSSQTRPLADCLPGWWLGLPLAQARCLQCNGPSAPPECKFSDCSSIDAEGFKPGGAYFAASATYSAQGGTASGFTVAGGRYTIVDGGYQVGSNQPIGISSCSDTELHTGAVIQFRAPANLAAALDRESADGGTTFTSLPVPP